MSALRVDVQDRRRLWVLRSQHQGGRMTDEEKAERKARLVELMERWWDPPAELIATLPKGGISLKYLGHSDTTRALIEADPTWTWEPMGLTSDGQPVLVLNDAGQPVGMWCWITVCGVRRPAYGSCLPGKGEAVKELIGDAIRNGAMRFGVAGGLWSKADRPGPEPEKTVKEVEAAQATAAGENAYADLVEQYGKEAVHGALAVHGISKKSELTQKRVEKMRESLEARKIVTQLQEDLGAEVEDK